MAKFGAASVIYGQFCAFFGSFLPYFSPLFSLRPPPRHHMSFGVTRQTRRLGRFGCQRPTSRRALLLAPKRGPYERQRVCRSRQHHHVTSTLSQSHHVRCRQHCRLFLFNKMRPQGSPTKPNPTATRHPMAGEARTVRSIDSIGERHFIVAQRKNKHNYRFEEVLSSKLQVWSLFHLLCQYVALTSKLVPRGGPLLLTKHRPWSGLTSDSIASLRGSQLTKFGVDMSAFACSPRVALLLSFSAISTFRVRWRPVSESGKTWRPSVSIPCELELRGRPNKRLISFLTTCKPMNCTTPHLGKGAGLKCRTFTKSLSCR